MTKTIAFAAPAVLALLSGCLSAPVAPTYWTINYTAPTAGNATVAKSSRVARLASLVVCAPYNGVRLAVLRQDGSIAFDTCHSFAASPESLFRGVAGEVLEGTGAFEHVVAGTQSAYAPISLDLNVRRLALDCREPGRRDATVALTLTMTRDRAVIASVTGEATASTGDGDYTKAFSKAFAQAIEAAVRHLPAAK